jgi:hypothetical protein
VSIEVAQLEDRGLAISCLGEILGVSRCRGHGP